MTTSAFCSVALAAALAFAPARAARAQTQTPPPAQAAPVSAEADQLLAAMDWSRAADAYQQVVQQEPANGRAWFRLGVARAHTGDDKRAVEAFERAGKLGLDQSPKVAWEAALAYARLKKEEQTIDWLSRVVDGGLRPAVLARTSAFDFMRDDPSFQALTARATANDTRTCGTPAYGGLDFWIGEWVVYDADRVRVGTDAVEKSADGCSLSETWSGTLGDTGHSLNFFDARANRWNQVWIGDTGGIVRQSGPVVDGSVQFTGQSRRPDGTLVTNRLTLAPLEGGRLRQLAETSTDNGRTWVTQFDFTFVRVTK